MSDVRPDEPPQWIMDVKVALRAALKALGQYTSDNRWEPDETTGREILTALSDGGKTGPLDRTLAKLPDAALILVQNVGRNAYRELVRRAAVDEEFQQELRKFLASLTEHSHQSVGQDAAMELLQRAVLDPNMLADKTTGWWPTFPEPGKVLAYYKNVYHNQIRRRWKINKTRHEHAEDVAFALGRDDESAAIEEVITREEERAMIEVREGFDQHLSELPLEERLAYVLYYRHGLSHTEIGNILYPSGISEDAARKRVSRTLEEIVKDLIVKAKLLLGRKPPPPLSQS